MPKKYNPGMALAPSANAPGEFHWKISWARAAKPPMEATGIRIATQANGVEAAYCGGEKFWSL